MCQFSLVSTGLICMFILIKCYCLGANVVIFVYDVTNRESFEFAKSEFEKAKSYIMLENTTIALVANKMDKEPQVDQKAAKEFAAQNGLLFFETSVEDSTRATTAVATIFQDLATKYLQQVPNSPPAPSIPMEQEQKSVNIVLGGNATENRIFFNRLKRSEFPQMRGLNPNEQFDIVRFVGFNSILYRQILIMLDLRRLFGNYGTPITNPSVCNFGFLNKKHRQQPQCTCFNVFPLHIPCTYNKDATSFYWNCRLRDVYHST